MRAIKGFDAKFQCRGFQFEVGQTYTHGGDVVACSSGFHAIPDDQHPLAVFSYYPPAGSRFAVVEVGGKTVTTKDKVAAEILSVQTEIGLHDLTMEAVEWVLSRARPEGSSATGTRGAASATGDLGAASATGTRGAASATGYQGAASATGDQGAASATGTRGAASATGDLGAAIATGPRGRVMGAVDGIDLFARQIVWDGENWICKSIACGTTGKDGIKSGVWYACVDSRLVEVTD